MSEHEIDANAMPPIKNGAPAKHNDGVHRVHDEAMFTITLTDSNAMKQKWPPSPLPLLTIAIILLSYPLWILLLTKYREHREEKESLESHCDHLYLVMDRVASLMLDQSPKLATSLLTLHVGICCAYIALWS
jgi:hypothetical protein